MLTSRVRLALIALFTLAGIYMAAQHEGSGRGLLLAAALLLFSHFRDGSVWTAFRAYKRGERERTRELIGQVKFPQMLSPRNRAYYDWIQGELSAWDGDLESAYKHLSKASQGKLGTLNDKSVAEYLLSAVARDMGDIGLSRRHLIQARSIPHGPELESAIADRELELNEAQHSRETTELSQRSDSAPFSPTG